MKYLFRLYNNKLWLFVLSVVTAVIVLWAWEAFGWDHSTCAIYFLCFCVSFSAYQIVSAISKSTESLLNEPSAVKEATTVLTTAPTTELCVHCGEPLTDGAKFCMYCGQAKEDPTVLAAEPAMELCAHCRKPWIVGAKFCIFCGQRQEAGKPDTNGRS